VILDQFGGGRGAAIRAGLTEADIATAHRIDQRRE
jgi:hypothetical protein